MIDVKDKLETLISDMRIALAWPFIGFSWAFAYASRLMTKTAFWIAGWQTGNKYVEDHVKTTR